MKKIICVLAVLLTLIIHAACAAEPANTADSLSTVGDNLNKKKAVLVDVREESEWKQGFITGSVHVPLSMLTAAVADKQKEVNDEAMKGLGEAMSQMLPKKTIVYTYCASGVRSVEAAKILGALGYEVRPLKPGFKDLAAAGFPTSGVEKPLTPKK